MGCMHYDYMRKLIHKPHDRYLSDLQNLINDRWTNSTQTIFNVLIETEIGSQQYEPIDVSVDTGVDIGTGFKKGDDFKVFSFRDITLNIPIGTMFKTEEDYWLCVNSNGFASPTNSCEVRRCNNIMKWIDPYSGKLYEQYCIIDYEMSSPRPRRDKDVVVADGHIFVIVQGSELTRSIEKNQRFIFNGQPYKFSAVQSLLDTNGELMPDTLLYMDMYLDVIQPDDDLINGIANVNDYQYNINIQQDVQFQTNGYNGQLVATSSLNGEVVRRDIEWSGNEYVIVNQDGSYTLNGNNGDVAVITAAFKDNSSIFAQCSISIIDESVEDNVIIIEPLITEVRQREPVSFTVYLCQNGIKQDTPVICNTSGADNTCFSIVRDGNIFTLSTIKVTTTPLELTFTVGDIHKTINVMLKALF
jgi:hypothetical protein